eukprot:scaffold128859_cov69-Phaeocystis_antarctica.AAC.6
MGLVSVCPPLTSRVLKDKNSPAAIGSEINTYAIQVKAESWQRKRGTEAGEVNAVTRAITISSKTNRNSLPSVLRGRSLTFLRPGLSTTFHTRYDLNTSGPNLCTQSQTRFDR